MPSPSSSPLPPWLLQDQQIPSHEESTGTMLYNTIPNSTSCCSMDDANGETHSKDTNFVIQVLQPDASLPCSPCSSTIGQRTFSSTTCSTTYHSRCTTTTTTTSSVELNYLHYQPTPLNSHLFSIRSITQFYPIVRFVFACTFFFTSSFLTRFITMYILVPSVDLTQPPLHDILLDRISSPFPEAFKITECITAVLALLMVLLSCFNRTHRFNILARFLLLDGILLILRIISMSSTILSIPNANDVTKCQTLQQMSLKERMFGRSNTRNEQETTMIGYTCGDYMFSGHTCAVTLCTFFVLYYSSTNYSFHSTSNDDNNSRIGRRIWFGMRFMVVVVLVSSCIMGLFCIVWSKEHYTADVVVACLLTVLLCMVYHYQLHLYCQVKAMKQRNIGMTSSSSMQQIPVEQSTSSVTDKTLFTNPLNWMTFWFFSWFEYDMNYNDILKSNEFDLKPLEWIGKVWKYIQSLLFRGMIPHQEEEEIDNS
ncbi:hypothetical protein C9374_008749 [Naegleria lovaniensis]|uniref:Sphingomyelin synthase-like domain-containing protein n=1 Tax=Naegleria lovaniensis TaxID=51637 RepID=A0AA88GES9_NAELO|nr:uncharacterized protein C9374_008749 [Naegleria lovaniensis]KAG2378127.1 hypothetical protein C9374_008749 [Naegleria lovaniensis]